MTITVTEEEMKLSLMSYMRYALPRHSYIVVSCNTMLRKYVPMLNSRIANDKFIREIQFALDHDDEMWDCDYEEWELTIQILKEGGVEE